MKQTYSVTIEKRHCDASSGYGSNYNCPLCVAIREQLPEFKLKRVGGTYVKDQDDQNWKFNHKMGSGWEIFKVENIESGRIKSYTVEFSREISNEIPKTERIVYVSVPQSIIEESKELILS